MLRTSQLSRGNRTSVQDALGKTTRSAYDSMSRLTTITYPDSGSTHFQLGRADQASGHPQEAQAEMAKARTLLKANSEGRMRELSREPSVPTNNEIQ